MRLDKFLSNCGLGTRSQVKDIIKSNKIKVNNDLVKKPEFNINPEKDVVYYEDNKIEYKEFYYFLLNKPKGYLSATEDTFQPTRLDKDTTGAIIITNDGLLAHQLISPKYHVDKIYIATLDKEVDPSIKEEFEDGIMLDGEKTLPAKIEFLDKNICRVTLHQGKYHQVKRMFEHFSYKVIELHRERFAFLTLDNLEESSYRELTNEEVLNLKSLCKK